MFDDRVDVIDPAEVTELQAYFEDQRRSLGRAHQLKNEVCASSHEGIAELGRARVQRAQEILTYSQRALEDLQDLNIPVDIKWQLSNDASQELAELAILIAVYPVLIGKTDIQTLKVPTDRHLEIDPPSYLVGLADAASEITKLVIALELNMVSDAATLEARGLYIVEKIAAILHQFDRTYPLVLNNTRRRGQGFHKKLRQVSFAELRIQERILGAKHLRSSLFTK